MPDSVCTTRIDLIRHGEPTGGDVFRGSTDLALTDKGRWQFDERIRRHQQPWQQIISSPLQRCFESAQALADAQQIPLCVEPAWQEIHYGDWENRPVNEVIKEHPLQAQALWQKPLEFCAPNGESVPDFQARIVAAWQQLLEAHQGQHLLVVNHGGVMRVLAQHLLSLAPEAMNRLSIPFAGLMRFRVDQTMDKSWVSLETLDGSELHPNKARDDDSGNA